MAPRKKKSSHKGESEWKNPLSLIKSTQTLCCWWVPVLKCCVLVAIARREPGNTRRKSIERWMKWKWENGKECAQECALQSSSNDSFWRNYISENKIIKWNNGSLKGLIHKGKKGWWQHQWDNVCNVRERATNTPKHTHTHAIHPHPTLNVCVCVRARERHEAKWTNETKFVNKYWYALHHSRVSMSALVHSAQCQTSAWHYYSLPMLEAANPEFTLLNI